MSTVSDVIVKQNICRIIENVWADRHDKVVSET